MANSLLTTKLFVPTTRSELVRRPRLMKKLNDGLNRKLTIVSAPAGFGKTTLVTEWLEDVRGDTNNKIGWLSLDDGDNDLSIFLTYFISALNQIDHQDHNFGKETLDMLQAPQPPEIKGLLTPLINDISKVPGKIFLVLDDYHLIEYQPIHDSLAFFLEMIPPNFHLIVSTREDPLFPLGRLRSMDQLTELRAADLRFNANESGDFLNHVMGLSLSSDEIDLLDTRTEGWVAGLQLVALSIQGQTDTANFIKSFTGSHRFVLDYLIEEVLSQLPERIHTFLLFTSILDRLCGPLCGAVLQDKGSSGQETLEYLERTNLFIIPLDNNRHWYRYHHLFADLLRERLYKEFPNQIPTLHKRASGWLEKESLISDSIQHAIAGEDYENAARLAELVWPSMSGSVQSIVWLGWMEAMPDEIVRTRPVLCVSYAFALLNSGNLEAAETRLLDAERCLELNNGLNVQADGPGIKMVIEDEKQFQALPVSLATARAYYSQAMGDVESTIKYAEQVLELIPMGYSGKRGDAIALLGLAYWTSGDLELAHQTFSEGLAGMDPLSVITGSFVLADIKMTLGHLNEAIRVSEHAIKLAKDHGEPFPMGTEDVYTGISHIHREQGNLDAAEEDLQISKKLGEQVDLPDWQYRWCIAQARLLETIGDLQGALDLLDEAERLYVRTPLPEVRPIQALKARVWIKQGKLVETQAWITERNLFVTDRLNFLQEFEHITLLRLFMSQYQNGIIEVGISEIFEMVERMIYAAVDGKRDSSEVELLILQALLFESQGDIPSALESLECALKLAEPEGYIYTFLDEGPKITELLNEAISQGIQIEYSRKLIAATERHLEGNTTLNNQQLVEPLSARELEVLHLVAQGLSNREIGERLFLALDTIKGYNRKIYGKLGVKNRTQAINKAKSLKIISLQ